MVFVVCFVFSFAFFQSARAANDQAVSVVGGPFSLASAWSGIFNVNGSPAAVQSIGVGYMSGTAEGSLVVVSGDTLSFSYTPSDPLGNVNGGLFGGEEVSGRWAPSLNNRSQCSAGPRVFSVGADQYSFVLCGTQPVFSLSSSNTAAVSCSGMVCTASGVGSTRITATIAGAPVKMWGMKSGEANWTELVSSTLPGATLSWNATVVLPPTLVFSMNGTSPIPYDTGMTLSWNAQNVIPTNPCVASGDWSGVKSANGTFDTGNLQARRDYTLTCTGPSGDTVSATKTVLVGSPTPGPMVSFSVGSTLVPSGTSTTLSWDSPNANTCVASGDWANPGPGNRSTTGNQSTGPITSAQTYVLQCTNAGGTTPRTITVNIMPSVSPPSFRDFSADPNPIPYNGSTTLSWDVQNAASCITSSDASAPINNWNGNTVSPFGSQIVSGLTSTTKFFLLCKGSGGTTPGNPVEVLVAPASLLPPAITFSADSGTATPIPYNTATGLHWSVARADFCWTLDGDDEWYHFDDDGLPHTSGDYTTSNLAETTSFGLSCSNMAGTMSKTIIIKVGAPGVPVTLNFSADRYSISYGESVNIQWSSQNATSCHEEEFSALSGGWLDYAYPGLSGDFSRSPKKSTTYVMTCSSPLPSSAKKSFTVVVDPLTIPDPLPDPPSIIFQADSSSGRHSTIAYNTGTMLRWSVQNATSCIASSDPNLSSWTGSKDPVSGAAFTGNLREETIFYLSCTGPGGKNDEWARFSVGNSSLSGPSLSFWADDFAVPSGQFTRLRWTSVGAVGQCEASGDWSGDQDTSSPPSGVKTENLVTPTTYRLTCSNAGGSITASVNVLVGSVSPTPSLSFWVDDPVVPVGGSTLLRWNAQNVSACTASADPVQPLIWSGPVSFVGGQSTGVLTTNQEYTLTCTDANGADVVAKTRVGAGSTFGTGPEMSLSAEAYLVPSGTVPTLHLQTFFASACRMNDDGVGMTTLLLPNISMTLDGAPYVDALIAPKTYTIECTDAVDPLSPLAFWNASRSLTINVGRMLLCPVSIPIVAPGDTLQFEAWYTTNPLADCATASGFGGINVTDSTSYETTWSVVNGNISFVAGSSGLVRANGPGPARIRGTHRPAAATIFFSSEADVIVGRPILCYKCDEASSSCSSDPQYDFVNDPAQCTANTFASLASCRFACFKDRWQEVAP